MSNEIFIRFVYNFQSSATKFSHRFFSASRVEQGTNSSVTTLISALYIQPLEVTRRILLKRNSDKEFQRKNPKKTNIPLQLSIISLTNITHSQIQSSHRYNVDVIYWYNHFNLNCYLNLKTQFSRLRICKFQNLQHDPSHTLESIQSLASKQFIFRQTSDSTIFVLIDTCYSHYLWQIQHHIYHNQFSRIILFARQRGERSNVNQSNRHVSKFHPIGPTQTKEGCSFR